MKHDPIGANPLGQVPLCRSASTNAGQGTSCLEFITTMIAGSPVRQSMTPCN